MGDSGICGGLAVGVGVKKIKIKRRVLEARVMQSYENRWQKLQGGQGCRRMDYVIG